VSRATAKPSAAIPIGARIRVIHGSHYNSLGRVVSGNGKAPRGELEGHLPSTSVLVAAVSVEVVR
jgi:hypothetical protein